MSQAPSMPLFSDAYLADTMHLSLEEHGAYLKLLMITWRNNGQPLPDDDTRISRMLGVTAAKWRAKLRPVLSPFFDLSGGVWRQKRLEKEWQITQENIKRQRERAKSRWNRNALENNNSEDATASPRHMPQECHPSPSPTPVEEAAPACAHEHEGDAASPQSSPAVAHAVGRKVLELMGVWDDPRWFGNASRVETWIRSGADPEADIYPTIVRLMASRNGEPPRSLKYFDAAIADAVRLRNTPMPTTTGGPTNGNRHHRRHGRPSTPERRAAIAEAFADCLDDGGRPA